jgi:hypothetical protein
MNGSHTSLAQKTNTTLARYVLTLSIIRVEEKTDSGSSWLCLGHCCSAALSAGWLGRLFSPRSQQTQQTQLEAPSLFSWTQKNRSFSFLPARKPTRPRRARQPKMRALKQSECMATRGVASRAPLSCLLPVQILAIAAAHRHRQRRSRRLASLEP